MKIFLSSVALVASVLCAQASECGDSIVVRRGDTLSSLAAKCDVNEAEILRANPMLGGSGDLRAGESVSLRPEAEGAVDRAIRALGSATREGADALTGLARDLKSSAADLLDKNPDLLSGSAAAPRASRTPAANARKSRSPRAQIPARTKSR